jgi:hypothetical protein
MPSMLMWLFGVGVLTVRVSDGGDGADDTIDENNIR